MPLPNSTITYFLFAARTLEAKPLTNGRGPSPSLEQRTNLPGAPGAGGPFVGAPRYAGSACGAFDFDSFGGYSSVEVVSPYNTSGPSAIRK